MLAEFTPLDADDAWAKLEGKTDTPIIPGSHYHLTENSISNSIISNVMQEVLVVLDATSSVNPYSSETYDGKNILN